MLKKPKENSWLNILTSPKETIQNIVDVNPNYGLFYLCCIYGFVTVMSMIQGNGFVDGMSLTSILIFVVVFSPVIGYLLFSINSWFIFITGKILNGQGTFKKLRAALSWSSVPLIFNLFVWIVLILIFKRALFSVEILNHEYIRLLGLFLSLNLIASVWSLVIFVAAVAQVQKFSILKAIGNIILGGLFYAVIIFIFFMLFYWTCSPFFDEPNVVQNCASIFFK